MNQCWYSMVVLHFGIIPANGTNSCPMRAVSCALTLEIDGPRFHFLLV